MTSDCKEIYYTSRDGLRLHAHHYPGPGKSRRAVVCLPGLTQNARSFHDLACRLSDPTRHRRDVYCVDYRGRGKSEHDPNWQNYTPLIECLDVLDLMTREGVEDAALVATSRGGMIAMIMAALRPSAIGAVVLNDIGPVIERDGLARIIGYVGRIPLPANWQEAGELVRGMNRGDFPAIPAEEWQDVARQWFNDESDAPTPSYDPNLAKAITSLDIENGIPDMWPQFRALSRAPMLTLRGENSDILSSQTVRRMSDVHPGMRVATVRGQGHAPLLRDQTTIGLIEQFLAESDRQLYQGDTMLSAVA